MYRTTEIASADLVSDNPVHQRLLFPYLATAPQVGGRLLEIGCGTGRGVGVLAPHVLHLTGVDKNEPLMRQLSIQYPDFKFIDMFLPPLHGLPDNQFDCVVTFQVIEHIDDDDFFVREAHRVLRPGGRLFLTTVNRRFSLTRNPWHVREYDATGLKKLLERHFGHVQTQGIHGNEKVLAYYEKNKMSVQRITRFDVLDLQHRLPRRWLQVPYDLANRLSRRFIQQADQQLVSDITHRDYFLNDDAENAFDFYYTATKS